MLADTGCGVRRSGERDHILPAHMIEQMAGASPVRYEPYRMGSAFLRTGADGA